MTTLRSGLRTLGAILGSPLAPAVDTGGIQTATHRVITHTRQILDSTTANQHNGVLLQVMTFATDVGRHFHTVRQSHTGDLAQRRVRLLRRRGIDARAYPTLLRTSL